MTALFLAAESAFAGATLSVGSVTGTPGSTVLVPVNLSADTNVVAMNFDLLYDSNYLSPGAVLPGPALADQMIGNGLRSPGDYIVLIYTFTYNPMTNGVIALVPFIIATNAPDLDEPLTLTNYLLLSDQQLDHVNPVNDTPGTLSVRLPPGFTSISTNPGAIHLVLAGTTGRTYAIQAATNLESTPQWTGIYTNTATNGLLEFDDPLTGGFSRRFYRAVLAQ